MPLLARLGLNKLLSMQDEPAAGGELEPGRWWLLQLGVCLPPLRKCLLYPEKGCAVWGKRTRGHITDRRHPMLSQGQVPCCRS